MHFVESFAKTPIVKVSVDSYPEKINIRISQDLEGRRLDLLHLYGLLFSVLYISCRIRTKID